MSCANPFMIKNKYYDPSRCGSIFQQEYLSVPCGWCLNCRIDRRNFLEDCCNYEYNNYGCGAFVTFTYDDNHIPMVTSPLDNIPRPTLRRDDVKKFLYRLRSKINYYGLDVKICNPRFKVLYCGEYGDSFGRPHYHFLFFGLDYMACQKIFYESWKNGSIESLPIKDGCFRYVLKYLDKQIKGVEAKKLYEDNNVEAPFSYHSVKFGYGMLSNQIGYIEKNNYMYKNGAFERPLPSYYKKQLLGHSNIKYFEVEKQLLSHSVKKDNSNGVYRYKKETMDKFKHRLAKIREKNLYVHSLDNGEPCYQPIVEDTSSYAPLASSALGINK